MNMKGSQHEEDSFLDVNKYMLEIGMIEAGGKCTVVFLDDLADRTT